jgi:hypothetical protein
VALLEAYFCEFAAAVEASCMGWMFVILYRMVAIWRAAQNKIANSYVAEIAV